MGTVGLVFGAGVAIAACVAVYLRAQHRLVPRTIERHRARDETRFLDLGAGDGLNAEWLRQSDTTIDVTCIDLANENRFGASIVYDGRTIPFPEKSFDSAIIAFVLHHVPATRQLGLVRELMRVTRRRLYVFEDSIASHFDRCLCAGHQRAFGTSTVEDARSADAWRAVFADAGLTVESMSLTSRFIAPWIRGCKCYLVQRVIFVLRVP
ncbi:MAG: class I SAM-dependent methyltransferase [Deltaproteobacteria bacterium]|nr:class I SAM-dependent methyltransferase [Deltaproteobacteria bacterium]